MTFRSDINFLRALAVVGVVIFHFYPGVFAGGFAGVDVFFVISGYLMTRIIMDSLHDGSFTFKNFYVKRFQRLYPALLVMCAALFFSSLLILDHESIKQISEQIISTLLFVSNLYFWQEAGYFSPEAHNIWLLHTWSLSVEWQFYLLYPVLLFLLSFWFSKRSLKIAILSILVAGVIFSLIFTNFFPSPGYYFFPSRAWELLAGSIIYFFPITVGKPYRKRLFYLGVLGILLSFMFLNSKMVWPGPFSLIPVMATIVVLYSSYDCSRLAKSGFIRHLGLSSYSIYLWHWPLVVFSAYFALGPFAHALFFLFSFILGFMGYKYVETSSSPVVSNMPVTGVALSILLSLCFYAYFQRGFVDFFDSPYRTVVERVSHSPFRDLCHVAEYQKPSESCEYFNEENVEFAVLGDSHGVEITYALAEKLAEEDVGVKHFTFSSCIPSYGRMEGNCSRWYNESVDHILGREEIQNVLLVHRYTSGLYSSSAEAVRSGDFETLLSNAYFRSLYDVIVELSKNEKKIFILLPIPELDVPINSLIGREHFLEGDLNDIVAQSRRAYWESNEVVLRFFALMPKLDNVQLIDATKVFCDDNKCFGTRSGMPLYFDDDHPSVGASRRIVNLIEY